MRDKGHDLNTINNKPFSKSLSYKCTHYHGPSESTPRPKRYSQTQTEPCCVTPSPVSFPGKTVAIKYNKYQKDLRETNKNLHKDIEENLIPDRNGPVPFATQTHRRALIGFDVPSRPVFSRSGNLPPNPHRGLQASKPQGA